MVLLEVDSSHKVLSATHDELLCSERLLGRHNYLYFPSDAFENIILFSPENGGISYSWGR